MRALRADEILCRVQQVKKTGCSLLLYKDARCDMRILDETYGQLNWQKSYEVVNGNLFCTVSIYDESKTQWVHKQDVGTESNTEKEKGEASDAFKRACFNLGIGRELYSSPFIWIKLAPDEVSEKNGRFNLNFGVKFHVAVIESENEQITKLKIIDGKGNDRFAFWIDEKGTHTKQL